MPGRRMKCFSYGLCIYIPGAGCEQLLVLKMVDLFDRHRRLELYQCIADASPLLCTLKSKGILLLTYRADRRGGVIHRRRLRARVLVHMDSVHLSGLKHIRENEALIEDAPCANRDSHGVFL